MSNAGPKPWTVDEFIAWERLQPERYEYVDGIVRMMVGGSHAHSALKLNIAILLKRAVSGSGCTVFPEGPKIRTSQATMYPDALVVCRPIDWHQPDDMFDDATVIAEVLSKSTADYDRGAKWLLYQTLPSLKHYILISQDERRVDLFSRQGNAWLQTTATGSDTLALEHVPVALPLDDLYESIVPVG